MKSLFGRREQAGTTEFVLACPAAQVTEDAMTKVKIDGRQVANRRRPAAPAPTGTLKADYDTNTLQLQASQTLFNLNSWYSYQAAVEFAQARLGGQCRSDLC